MSIAASAQTQPAQEQQVKLSSVKALVFKQIRFWLGVSGGSDEVDPETGKTTHWIFKSARELTEELHRLYDGLSVSRQTIFRALQALVKMGLLQAKKRRKNRFDQTTWYALTDLGARITGQTQSSPPEQSTETPDTTGLLTVEQHQRSTSKETSKKRKSSGFGQWIRTPNFDQKRSPSGAGQGFVASGGARPAEKPAGRIQINGIWVVDDGLFPSYC
jgi:DNA-binding PadR family transcriptional regulator